MVMARILIAFFIVPVITLVPLVALGGFSKATCRMDLVRALFNTNVLTNNTLLNM